MLYFLSFSNQTWRKYIPFFELSFVFVLIFFTKWPVNSGLPYKGGMGKCSFFQHKADLTRNILGVNEKYRVILTQKTKY